MGSIIEIKPQIRTRRTEFILDPEKDLREIINADMGPDAMKLYDEVIQGIHYEYEGRDEGDDFEAMSDGYLNFIIDIMNELDEILDQKRLSRPRLEKLCDKIRKNV